MNIKIILSLVLSIILFSCGGDTTEPITLDNGEKWTIIKTMDVYLQEMEDLVNNFDGKTLDEYHKLANELKENIKLLTSNCTMKGQAHDELHKWLLPYINVVDTFSKSTTEQDAENIFQEIKASFISYNKYFK